MPTYEYRCQKCSHTFEAFHRINAPPPRACPRCKKGKVKKAITAGAGLLFKGSGFYTTDYRSAGYKDAAKKDKPPTESSASKSDTTSKADSSKSTAKPAAGKSKKD